ncbi:GNAT family N-acetyltransferase [Clostridium sp.]|uniref:GNAT family N-acetyltransferase n=1 Tax=Clostridium sp. TaxID=1506 RepID=UPI003217487D
MNIFRIERYKFEYEKQWDNFIFNDAINGTFLQSRRFLNYHPKERFSDSSLIIFDEKNEIVGVIPACEYVENGELVFDSHKGSTFGGVIISKKYNNIASILEVIDLLEKFLYENSYNRVLLKNTSQIFSKENVSLINYLLYSRGYDTYEEINSVIDLDLYEKEDILSNCNATKKKQIKKAIKNGFRFRALTNDNELKEYYSILEENIGKFGKKPVHSYEELKEFKNFRLRDQVIFMGIFLEDKMIAGAMLFNFNNKGLHAQYISSKQDYLKLFPVQFIYYKIIEYAIKEEYKYVSWGISTLNHGRELNKGLLEFKTAFGSKFDINKSYFKKLE